MNQPSCFDHQLKPPYELDEDGYIAKYPGPLVVLSPPLTSELLPSLARHLIDTIESRYNDDRSKTNFFTRPLELETSTGLKLTERALWTILVEEEGADEWVAEYVDRAIATCGGLLSYITGEVVLSQEVVYAYLDRWVRREVGMVRHIPPTVMKVIDAFERFVYASDMDHAVHQFDYIKVVTHYLWSNPERQADFIAFSLLETQFDVFEHDERFRAELMSRGHLKRIIDRAIEKEHYRSSLYCLTWELCTAIYGSDENALDDVLNYVVSKSGVAREELHPRMLQRIKTERAIRDLELSFRNRAIRKPTGFHNYDDENNSWIKIPIAFA